MEQAVPVGRLGQPAHRISRVGGAEDYSSQYVVQHAGEMLRRTFRKMVLVAKPRCESAPPALKGL